MLAIGSALTVEQRLQKAVVDIMGNNKYIALAGILMIGERTVDDQTPTACTNGKDEWYGRDFVDEQTDAGLRYLLLHENYHKLYRHLITWTHLWKEDARLANIAMDYVINLKISDDNTDGFAVPPKGALLDERFRDLDTAQVFNILKQERGNSTTGNGVADQGFDEHDWEGAQELTADEQRELERDIDEAVRQGALIAGKLGSGGDRDLKELLQPQIDWREVMRDFITTTCMGSDYSTWRRPNRRYIAAGYYMPSGISERVEELVIAGDMSGSIGDPEVSVILTEIKSVCDTVHPETARILYWDTKVCADEKYEGPDIDNIVTSTRPAGGGGTDVTCVPTYMDENNISPQAVIIVTDGYLGNKWGQWNCPILWVIIDNKDARPDCGIVLHVTSRQLASKGAS
jgi:predicted metal-dependent peptidase|tara:strand:- start:219 stop:1424 length:1206 start_codon:yes stop_codon:yes gene_type:complete